MTVVAANRLDMHKFSYFKMQLRHFEIDFHFSKCYHVILKMILIIENDILSF